MILLDTNVVSEAIKPESHPSVRAWLDAQLAETLFLPSITIAELLFGIGALSEGRRKSVLAARIDGVLQMRPLSGEYRKYTELPNRGVESLRSRYNALRSFSSGQLLNAIMKPPQAIV